MWEKSPLLVSRKISNIERTIQREIYAVTQVRKLVKTIVPSPIKAMNTQVRGYHEYTNGSKVDPGQVVLMGQTKETVEKVVNLLKENGVTIRNTKYCLQGGMGIFKLYHLGYV